LNSSKVYHPIAILYTPLVGYRGLLNIEIM
jgi:hypothetical protein